MLSDYNNDCETATSERKMQQKNLDATVNCGFGSHWNLGGLPGTCCTSRSTTRTLRTYVDSTLDMKILRTMDTSLSFSD
jgi:hypothetical protein